MDLLGNIGEKVGLGNVDLDNIKKQASFFLRDKINSARLFLTDVTPSQLLTEEATNDEEWGPATKVMASIAEACCHMEDYPRVMQVLHGRLSLIGKKHWRQFLKTLTVVEYLLLHGPEEIALEFSSDRDLIEDLSRFNYVDDRMVDRGIVVRQKAKQVLRLLMEDDILKEERSRAQKLSKSILGLGNFSSSSSGAIMGRFEGFGSTGPSRASRGLLSNDESEGSYLNEDFTVSEDETHLGKKVQQKEETSTPGVGSSSPGWRAFADVAPVPATQSKSGWADFSQGLSLSGKNTTDTAFISASKEGPSEEDSAEESFFQSSNPGKVANPVESAKHTPDLPADELVQMESKPRTVAASVSKPRARTNLPATVFKLPPPPRGTVSSKVSRSASKVQETAQSQSIPDLMDLSFESKDASIDLASLVDQVPLSQGAVSSVPVLNQGVADFLVTPSEVPSIATLSSPGNEVPSSKGADTTDILELKQAGLDHVDVSSDISSTSDSAPFGHLRKGAVPRVPGSTQTPLNLLDMSNTFPTDASSIKEQKLPAWVPDFKEVTPVPSGKKTEVSRNLANFSLNGEIPLSNTATASESAQGVPNLFDMVNETPKFFEGFGLAAFGNHPPLHKPSVEVAQETYEGEGLVDKTTSAPSMAADFTSLWDQEPLNRHVEQPRKVDDIFSLLL